MQAAKKQKRNLPFLSKKSKVLMLEIGEEWLKFAAFEEQGSKRKILFLHEESIQDLSEVDISQKVSAFLKKKLFKPRRVVISHPAHNLTTRILSLPSKDPKEIGDILELQAVKQTPYTREEITIGFDILDTDDQGYSRVLLAISQIDIAAKYHRIAEMAGCFASQITLSFEGLKYWAQSLCDVEKLPANETFLLLNVDSLTTEFFIMKGRKLLFARSLGYGAHHIKTKDQIESVYLNEVQSSIELGEAELKEDKVKSIYVTGAPKPLTDLSQVLSERLFITCKVASTFEGSEGKVPKKLPDATQDFSSSFVSLVGHSLHPAPPAMDLMPPEITIRRGLEARAKDLAIFGTLLLALVTIISGIGFEKIYKKTSYLANLKKQYQSIKSDSEEVERVVAKMKLAKEQLSIGHSFLDVMYDINDVLPTNIYLTSVQYSAKEQNTTIRGISEDMSSVFQFLSTLEAAPHLAMVKTRSVTKRKIDEKDVSEFEIVATLVGPGEEVEDAGLSE